MQLSPINSTNFRGFFVDRYPQKINGEPNLTGMGYWHPNSALEATIGAFHTRPRNKIYVADPMEPVRDEIKQMVDYIVYDHEPLYPRIEDVEKNYLEKLRINFRKKFAEIRDYFYRREMGGFANIDEAKFCQWQAAECIRMYDEAGHYRFEKERAEDRIATLNREVQQINESLPKKKEELQTLQQRKAILESKSKTTQKKLSLYEKLQQLLKDEVSVKKGDKAVITTEKETVAANAQRAQETIQELGKAIVKCEKEIEALTAFISSAPKLLSSKKAEIKEKETLIESLKAKLKPLFENLRKFYEHQGIRMVRK